MREEIEQIEKAGLGGVFEDGIIPYNQVLMEIIDQREKGRQIEEPRWERREVREEQKIMPYMQDTMSFEEYIDLIRQSKSKI